MKWKLIFAAVILCTVSVFLIILFSQGGKPSSFEIVDGQFSIGGMFGTSVLLSDIEDLELTETPPAIVKRTNGSGIGMNYKGEFLLKDDIKARLYIDASKSPFIVFSSEGTVFYINLDTAEKTESLYQELAADIGK